MYKRAKFYHTVKTCITWAWNISTLAKWQEPEKRKWKNKQNVKTKNCKLEAEQNWMYFHIVTCFVQESGQIGLLGHKPIYTGQRFIFTTHFLYPKPTGTWPHGLKDKNNILKQYIKSYVRISHKLSNVHIEFWTPTNCYAECNIHSSQVLPYPGCLCETKCSTHRVYVGAHIKTSNTNISCLFKECVAYF